MFILKNINNYLGMRISGITQKKSPRLKQQHQEILNALYYSDFIKDTPKYFPNPIFPSSQQFLSRPTFFLRICWQEFR